MPFLKLSWLVEMKYVLQLVPKVMLLVMNNEQNTTGPVPKLIWMCRLFLKQNFKKSGYLLVRPRVSFPALVTAVITLSLEFIWILLGLSRDFSQVLWQTHPLGPSGRWWKPMKKRNTIRERNTIEFRFWIVFLLLIVFLFEIISSSLRNIWLTPKAAEKFPHSRDSIENGCFQAQSQDRDDSSSFDFYFEFN